MPQKHDNYTRKVFNGIGEGGGGKSDYKDYKDCFRSQKYKTMWLWSGAHGSTHYSGARGPGFVSTPKTRTAFFRKLSSAFFQTMKYCKGLRLGFFFNRIEVETIKIIPKKFWLNYN